MRGTPAETLRRAAKLMRENAEAATAGPWQAHGQNDDWYVSSATFGLVSTGIHEDPSAGDHALIERDRRDAEHIASMHPGVALTVAEWMEEAAERTDNPFGAKTLIAHALKVARTYLGEST